jgi:RNA polymerase sigma-70 factor (ECF subfamily)
MTGPTDTELLRAADDDPSAFRALYDRYAGRIHAYHQRRSSDADAAHDLTAETFAQAWLSRHRFRDEAGGSVGPWLFGIARRVLLVSVRRRRIERSACERLGVLEDLGREPAAVEPHDAWLEGLDDELLDLPEGQRDAIRLRVLDDLSYEAVADALGTTPLGARTRVARGLGTLRGRIQNLDRPESVR